MMDKLTSIIAKARSEMSAMNSDKKGQFGTVELAIGLLILIAVGTFGVVMVGTMNQAVISGSIYANNNQLATVQNNFIPNIALALAGGAMIAAIVIGFTFLLNRR